MKLLKTIKTDHLIAIDIETVRIIDKYDDLDGATKMAWQYKNKQEGVIPDDDKLSELWERSASLYAEFSKICAISIAFKHDNDLYCKEIYGNDEKDILLKTAKTMEKIYTRGVKNGIQYRLVGHASKFFDFPFMSKRFIINDIDIPEILDATDEKPWTQLNLCTNDIWRCGGTGAGSSLQALCNVLNLPISKVDLIGDEVGTAYYNEEYEKIGRYCSYDTVATMNIMLRFKKEPIIQFDDVIYVTEPAEEIEETLSVLQKLHYEDYLSDDIKCELKEHFKTKIKKFTKKNKTEIQDILLASYISQEFMKSDNKETIERKTNEIVDFINKL